MRSSICCESARLESHWGRIALIIGAQWSTQTKPFCLRCWAIWATKTLLAVPCQSRRVVSYAKNCAPYWDSGTRCWHQDQVVTLAPGLFERLTLVSQDPDMPPPRHELRRCRSPWYHCQQFHSAEEFQTVFTTVCGPRNRSVVQGVMALLGDKTNAEGLDFLTRDDFKDAFKQLHDSGNRHEFQSTCLELRWAGSVVQQNVVLLGEDQRGGLGFSHTGLRRVHAAACCRTQDRGLELRWTDSAPTEQCCSASDHVDDPIIPLEGLCTKAEVGHGSLVVVGVVGAETRLREGVILARGSLDWHAFGDQRQSQQD